MSAILFRFFVKLIQGMKNLKKDMMNMIWYDDMNFYGLKIWGDMAGFGYNEEAE